MKIPRRKHPTNTQADILELVRKGRGLTPEQIARMLWPTSKQVAKKATTVEKHLRDMERRGEIVMRCGLACVPQRSHYSNAVPSPALTIADMDPQRAHQLRSAGVHIDD